MSEKQINKMLELARRLREYGDTKVKCDVETTDDYFKITELNPSEGFVTISKDDGDFIEEFPISSLSDKMIDDILYDAECTIEQEEQEIEKVFDRNEWARMD